jgi:hypothetical protein
MTERRAGWRRIEQDGAEWEARVIPGPDQAHDHQDGDGEILEFVCLDGSRKSRQLAVAAGSYQEMDEAALRRAFVKSRPIGGDHYGRPGKHMNDAD